MSSSTDLSIIIVNWNTRDYVLACLASIVNGRPKVAYELIVIDNGSDDRCLDAVATSFPEVIRVGSGTNLGFARANNLGLCRARGRFLMLLNPDTVVAPGALDAMVGYADAHPEVGVLGPVLRNPDGTRQPSAGLSPSLLTELVAQAYLFAVTDWGRPIRRRYSSAAERRFQEGPKAPEDVDWVSGACLMLRRSLVDEVGLLDENYFMYVEDADMCRCVRAAGYRVVYLPSAEVVHYGAVASSQAFSDSYVHGTASMLHYFAKYHSPVTRALLRTVIIAGSLARIGFLLAGSLLPGNGPLTGVRLRRQFHIIRLCLRRDVRPARDGAAARTTAHG